MHRSAMLGLLLLAGTGCSFFNHLRIDPVATSFQKPSNVAVYVAVTEHGKPIGNLPPASFRIYENELLLSADDTQQRVLPQELAVYHHTVLLVDVSGESSKLEPLSRAVAGFVEGVQITEAVSVFAFDGRPNLELVAEFPKRADKAPADLRVLTKLGHNDSSRNLYGALLSGLKELDARLARQSKPLKVGSLVVFTRGVDLAGRVSRADADRALSETAHDVLALGIAEQAESTLAELGKAGVVQAQDADSLGIAFEEAAGKVRDLYEKYYLIGYCSPARGGTRRLKVEVRFRDPEGDDFLASFSQDFDATGFGPGCRPETPPRFVPPVARRVDQAPARAGGEPGPSLPRKEPAPAANAPAADEDSVAPPPNKPGYSH